LSHLSKLQLIRYLPRDAMHVVCPRLSVAIISGTGKATDFKFGPYIRSVHPNKSPLNILEKRERWRIHAGTVQIFWVPSIISGTGKATNVTFGWYIHRIDRNKSPLKMSGKVAVGVVRDSRKF